MKPTNVRIVFAADCRDGMTATQDTQVLTDSGELLPVTKIVLTAEPNDVWRAELTMLVEIPKGEIAARLLSEAKPRD